LRPDVTLVDINLGGESGFELAEQLSQVGGPRPSPGSCPFFPPPGLADMIGRPARPSVPSKSTA
jgi:hypothetical protein